MCGACFERARRHRHAGSVPHESRRTAMRVMIAMLVFAVSRGVCRPAAAQYPGPFSNPRFGPQASPFNTSPVSPYLNLVRGNNPALGLYLGTYPEIDRQRFQNSAVQAF